VIRVARPALLQESRCAPAGWVSVPPSGPMSASTQVAFVGMGVESEGLVGGAEAGPEASQLGAA